MKTALNTSRNLTRNKIRTVLTVLGVSIGIYAMVVLGSLAEYLDHMVDSAKTYMGGVVHMVTKTDKKGQNQGVSKETLEKIRKLDEVETVTPFLILLLDGFDMEKRPLSFFSPQFTVGGIQDVDFLKSGRQGLKLVKGRWLKKDDEFHVLISQRLSKKRGYKVGGTILVRKKKYHVIGVLQVPEIPAAPDAFIPYQRLVEDFQKPSTEFVGKLMSKHLPPALAPMAEDIAEQVVKGLHGRYYPYYIVPKQGADVDQLIAKVRKIDPTVAIIPPKKLIADVESAMMLFTLIMLCIGFISSVVAGLLIVNTLVMSILERKREIGIKMAIGASHGQIIREFLTESAMIGTLGGIVGISLGIFSIWLANPWIRDLLETGNTLFLVTPRLVIGVFLFALILSCLSGLYPAYRAAKLDPVETLRNL